MCTTPHVTHCGLGPLYIMHDIVAQTIWKVHGYQRSVARVILGALLGHEKVHAVRPMVQITPPPICQYHGGVPSAKGFTNLSMFGLKGAAIAP